MPQFACMSCSTGFYSAASLANSHDHVCSSCGSLLETIGTSRMPHPLTERLGHLIARREVVRAQARVDLEDAPYPGLPKLEQVSGV